MHCARYGKAAGGRKGSAPAAISRREDGCATHGRSHRSLRYRQLASPVRGEVVILGLCLAISGFRLVSSAVQTPRRLAFRRPPARFRLAAARFALAALVAVAVPAVAAGTHATPP